MRLVGALLGGLFGVLPGLLLILLGRLMTGGGNGTIPFGLAGMVFAVVGVIPGAVPGQRYHGWIPENLRVPAVVVALLIGLSACSPPTTGPVVRIDETGWTADPPSVVQQGDRFRFVVDNSLEVDVQFVILRLYYGEVTDLPLVEGVVDVSQQVVYDGEDPIVAFGLYPEFERGDADWEPRNVAAGSATTVNVGTGLGGGEPGRFVVVSYLPGSIAAGHYAVFDMTDENGDVPMFTDQDFHPIEGQP